MAARLAHFPADFRRSIHRVAKPRQAPTKTSVERPEGTSNQPSSRPPIFLLGLQASIRN
jgi:hypothetical protein